ncbi:MAG: DUF4331 family protein [Ignavibacteriae bacterium]|nr:DUF4331 family protein [Ignavibacteriota bacterium]
MKRIFLGGLISALVAALVFTFLPAPTDASSHREAPLISNDPLADNCDLYVFRSPDDTNKVTIVATYIPLELPEGGPNYATFGRGVRYEIHVKNRTSVGVLGTATDDITYRFTFSQVNQDPTTFFNIRLGQQNLKTSYICEKSTNGGLSWTTIVGNGVVPPNYIGPRSIAGAAGLNTTYQALVNAAIANASTGERIFCGPRDDPFFVDLGGVFDLGQTRNAYGNDPANSQYARDAVAGFNTHAIIIQAPINLLAKNGNYPNPANILDPDFVIGVWASASRQQITTLSPIGGPPSYSGPWVQVSRLGMPLTNEAVIPIGQKDYWNAVTPYSAAETSFVRYFSNPELGLYMDDTQFGGAVPALAKLRMPSVSYPAIGVIPGYTTAGFDFRVSKDGAFAATRIPGINFTGTAFAAPLQPGLVAAGQPRRVDLYPIFYFGVPNLIPYQLAITRKNGPLGAGKPFIHNFLPITQTPNGDLYGGDLLRLNMATPVTPRGNSEYINNARMGLIRAAAIGLTASPFKDTLIAQRMPHLDGFPNGRRLEDDVTTIALQAVGGLVLAAVGLPFNDAVAANYSDLVSPKLVDELTYNAGPTKNDLPLLTSFPYLADPHSGWNYVKQLTAAAPNATSVDGGLGIGVPKGFILEQNYPNPFNPSTAIKYNISTSDVVQLKVFDALGQEVATLVNERQNPGTYTANWDAKGVASGVYYYRLEVGNTILPAKKAMLIK